MATLFFRHNVADYAAWRKVYDEIEPQRKPMGVTSHGVYQADGNPNDVTGYHEFDSMEHAKAFAGIDLLRDAMHRAGVQGTPDIWFAERV